LDESVAGAPVSPQRQECTSAPAYQMERTWSYCCTSRGGDAGWERVIPVVVSDVRISMQCWGGTLWYSAPASGVPLDDSAPDGDLFSVQKRRGSFTCPISHAVRARVDTRAPRARDPSRCWPNQAAYNFVGPSTRLRRAATSAVVLASATCEKKPKSKISVTASIVESVRAGRYTTFAGVNPRQFARFCPPAKIGIPIASRDDRRPPVVGLTA